MLGEEEEEVGAALAAAMRFSRRQRNMEVDEDLDADKAVEMQEERAAQQRCNTSCTCEGPHTMLSRGSGLIC